MKRRTQYELIFDLLKVMEKEENLTLSLIADLAYMQWDTARTYFHIIGKSKLALLSGITPIDSAVITQKGLQYLATFREMEHLMRSGLPDT